MRIQFRYCLLTVLLTGCATTGVDSDSRLSAARAAMPASVSIAAPAVNALDPAVDSAQRAEPTLIRGNDRMHETKNLPPVRIQGADVSLQFEQVSATEFIHAVLGDILQLPYAINQPLTGAITVHTTKALPRNQIFPIFESLLQANGIRVVQDADGVFHVGRPETLRGIAPALGAKGDLPAGYRMVVIPLEYVGVAEMAEILQPVASPEAFVRIDTFRNLLVLAGTREQILGWSEIINTFDVDVLKGMSVGLFPLTHTSAKEVDAGMKAVFAGTSAGAAPSPAAGARQAAPADTALSIGGPIAGVVRVVALERLNALLVITSRVHYLDLAREWIEKFDRPRDGGTEPQLYVYPVQNGTARHLSGLLNAVFGGEAQATGTKTQQRAVAPGLGSTSISSGLSARSTLAGASALGAVSQGGTASNAAAATGDVAQVVLPNQVRVVADDQQNALLIFAPKSEYTKIEAALRRLDVSPTQVLIEASILEVTLNDELSYGLQWYFDNAIGKGGWSGTGQLTSGETDLIGTTNPGFSYSVTNPLGQIRAVLNALAKKSLLNVISSPSIMVLDNQTAHIHVGDQQPIRSSQTVTDGGTTTSSIQYKDTGVLLAVSPTVNAGGMVVMNVDQSVTDVGQVDIATGQRAFLQRQISSRVAVRSGETLVLGGLIRDNNNRERQGLPLLHDIPVLGNLFGTTTKSVGRTELLVMITPRVISNEADLRGIGDEMRMRMRSLDLLPGRIGIPRSQLQVAPPEDQSQTDGTTDAETINPVQNQ